MKSCAGWLMLASLTLPISWIDVCLMLPLIPYQSQVSFTLTVSRTSWFKLTRNRSREIEKTLTVDAPVTFANIPAESAGRPTITIQEFLARFTGPEPDSRPTADAYSNGIGIDFESSDYRGNNLNCVEMEKDGRHWRVLCLHQAGWFVGGHQMWRQLNQNRVRLPQELD